MFSNWVQKTVWDAQDDKSAHKIKEMTSDLQILFSKSLCLVGLYLEK